MGMLNEETLNMQTVTMREFTDFIKDAIEMENFNTPILCLGKSGIGKTESIASSVTKPLGIGLVEMRLGSYNESDLVGIPYFTEANEQGKRYTKFADMGKLPHLESTGEGTDPDVGVLVFDEFTTASRPVRAVALQLMDISRSLGDYKLPPKWIIVVLGNGPTDGGMFNGLEYAIISRSMCFRVNPHFQSWKEWAIQNEVHPSVIGFIQQNGEEEMLHRIESVNAEYECKECNPRSWTKLSEYLKKKEERMGGALKSRLVEVYSGAAVGADLAVRFATYYNFYSDLIPMEDIISGRALSLDINSIKIEVLYTQQIGLISTLQNLLRRNREYIENYKLPPEGEFNKIQNILYFILKIKTRSLDLASDFFRYVNVDCDDLFALLISIDEFDDEVPEIKDYMQEHSNFNRIRRSLSDNMQ